MASSKVMASWSPTNPDPPRQPSPPRSRSRGFGSMNIDDIFKNICPDSLENVGGGVGDRGREEAAEEVWRGIVGGGGEVEDPTMTLEDFLSKTGAADEHVRVSAAVTMDPPPIPGFVMGAAAMSPATGIPAVQFDPDGRKPGGFGVDFRNETVAASGGGGREKRKAAVEPPLDKVSLQKQRRMIKNRESAARSRERKQAHTMELEALVSHLEMDNDELLKEEAETNKARYQQLMKNIIPVTEKPKPAKALLKKVPSMEW